MNKSQTVSELFSGRLRLWGLGRLLYRTRRPRQRGQQGLAASVRVITEESFALSVSTYLKEIVQRAEGGCAACRRHAITTQRFPETFPASGSETLLFLWETIHSETYSDVLSPSPPPMAPWPWGRGWLAEGLRRLRRGLAVGAGEAVV